MLSENYNYINYDLSGTIGAEQQEYFLTYFVVTAVPDGSAGNLNLSFTYDDYWLGNGITITSVLINLASSSSEQQGSFPIYGSNLSFSATGDYGSGAAYTLQIRALQMG
jgi:hypothetical protein